MSEATDKMSAKNWFIFIPGAMIFILGFVLLSFVGHNPEGILGLIAPVTILAGIIITTAGLLVR
ncbi:MAG: hypothetical protein HZC28_05905 [Spirochaetes bacterium]|nr:hypothetical protein [Spirochaetota bacterium]